MDDFIQESLKELKQQSEKFKQLSEEEHKTESFFKWNNCETMRYAEKHHKNKKAKNRKRRKMATASKRRNR